MGSRPAQSGAAVAKRLQVRWLASGAKAALHRQQSELMNLMMSSTPGISAFPRSDDSLLAWQATLEGPVGTPYEGLTYRLSINFGEDFPFQAPMVRFETPCYRAWLSGRARRTLRSV
jgi:ubiquitin-protein ligase